MYIWTLALGAEESLPNDLLLACRQLISEQEEQRADRFMFAKDRNRYLVAHALCRVMLSSFDQTRLPQQWIFDAEERGRPFIQSDINRQSLDFNLSHTLGMVGCAVSEDGRIGFDLEPKDRQANLDALAEKQFAILEQQHYASAESEPDKARRFFQFWTLKESYIKLTGKGLSEDLSSFSFDLNATEPKCYLGNKQLIDHQFGLFDAGDRHQAAWAYRSRNAEREFFNIKPKHKHLTLESFSALF